MNKKGLKTALLGGLLSVCLTTQADESTQKPVPTLAQVLDPQGSGLSDSVGNARVDILREMGETIGFRSGLAFQARVITDALQKKAIRLDRIYQFGTLVTSNSSLPPVIVEANDVATITPAQLRTANKVYDILKPEEFVSVPPTWRDYLFTGLMVNPQTEFPGDDAKPKNSAEREAWEGSVTKGWEHGVEQANQILDANFNRLTRDYIGMVRFSTLLHQGVISKAVVASTSSTVSSESTKDKLVIGERYQQIIKKAEFQTNPDKWTPVVTKSVPASTYKLGGR